MNEKVQRFSKAEAKKRVAAALVLIENAQRAINLAQEKLSPVVGFSEEWTRTGEIYDTIKDHWSAVNARLAEALAAGNDPRLDDFTLQCYQDERAKQVSAASIHPEKQP